MKRIPLFEFLLVAVLLLTHLAAALMPAETMLRLYTTDDAFYYFKVAQNISQGRGSTFDGFGLTNGYHPLWMLVCVPVFSLARFDIFLPLRLLILVMGLLHAATGLLLYRMVKQWLTQPIAMAVGVLWVFSPFVHRITAQNGLEAGLSAFLLVLTLSLLAGLKPDGPPPTTRKLVIIGFAAALAVMARLDNIFVILVLGTWLTFRSSPIRYTLSLDILVIAGSVWVSYIARFGLGLEFYEYKTSTFVMIAVGMLFKIVAGYFLGLYQPPLSMPTYQRVLRAALVVSIGAAGVAAVMLVLVKLGVINLVNRKVILFDWVISFIGIAGIRLVIDWLANGRLPVSTPASPWKILLGEYQGWLHRGLVFYGILGGVLATYMGWSYLVFGTPMPVSGQIKEWWGANYTIYGRPTDRISVFLGIDMRFIYAQPGDTTPEVRQSRRGPWVTALSWLMNPTRRLPKKATPLLWAAYALAGLVLLKSRRTMAERAVDQLALLPLLAGCLLQVWTYSARGYVAMKEWYWVAELLFTCLAAGTLLDALVRLVAPSQKTEKMMSLREPDALSSSKQSSDDNDCFAKSTRNDSSMAAWACLAVVCLLVSVKYARMVDGRLDPPRVILESESYLPVVAQVEKATRPGSVIGLTGGGDMAYLIHNRTVVNLDGLISSYAYFTALKNQQVAAYLDSIGLDYVYGTGTNFTQNFPYRKTFRKRLRLVTSFQEGDLFRFVEANLSP